jgi:hypothetical protein
VLQIPPIIIPNGFDIQFNWPEMMDEQSAFVMQLSNPPNIEELTDPLI